MPCKPTSSSISLETRAIIKRKTRKPGKQGKDYKLAEDLPSYLDLSYCEDLVDVSALGNVETLILEGCTSVVDVSALGGVQTLFLTGCTGITDV